TIAAVVAVSLSSILTSLVHWPREVLVDELLHDARDLCSFIDRPMQQRPVCLGRQIDRQPGAFGRLSRLGALPLCCHRLLRGGGHAVLPPSMRPPRMPPDGPRGGSDRQP